MKTLQQAGIDPKTVDAVVMSHAHIDHCGGIMADDKTSHFPNAQFYITQADYDFWTDQQKVGDKFKVFWETATKNLVPNRDRMHFIRDGEEFLPGIQAILAPGHTVGHTIFMISSGGQQLCYIGDLTHHPVLLMEHPLTQFAYDTDPAMSAQSRVKMLTMLADNRIPILAYHFAWPGLGNVAKAGEGSTTIRCRCTAAAIGRHRPSGAVRGAAFLSAAAWRGVRTAPAKSCVAAQRDPDSSGDPPRDTPGSSAPCPSADA